MRPSLLIIVTLALGFSLGWLAHRPAETPVTNRIGVETSGATSASTSASLPKVAPLAAPARDSRDEHRARIEALKWLRESEAPVYVQVFLGDQFNDNLARMLGLNAAEKARLIQAAQTAKTQLEAARAPGAVLRQAPDGTSLIVDVPALDVAASGAIYDRFRDTLQSTLGPERLDIFNELSGDAFERSFDRFGLNAVRYEISPPHSLNGSPLLFLEYKRHYIDASGSSTGWGSGRALVGEIDKTDGLLAKVLPSSFQVQPSR